MDDIDLTFIWLEKPKPPLEELYLEIRELFPLPYGVPDYSPELSKYIKARHWDENDFWEFILF